MSVSRVVGGGWVGRQSIGAGFQRHLASKSGIVVCRPAVPRCLSAGTLSVFTSATTRVIMFVAVQIPLADLRYFVGEPKARLSVPAWPLADPTKNFIRGVGSVRERRLGGVPEWIGESLYCDARHALVFPPDRGTVVHEGSPIAHLTPLYRRFVAFGQAQWGGAVARMDVGFKVRGRYTTGKPTGRILPIPEVAALAAATVKLKLPPDDRLRTLLTSGDAIADKLRTVTTSLVDPPASVNRWWVRAGIPLVLIEAPFTERFIASLDPPTELGIASPEAHDSLALQHFSQSSIKGRGPRYGRYSTVAISQPSNSGNCEFICGDCTMNVKFSGLYQMRACKSRSACAASTS